MSYNGSGTFVINSTGQPVVTGTVISSSTFNSLTADLGTGLSTAITKDGQTTTTAKIPFAQGLSAAVASNFAAGTVGAPSIYLSTDTTTGLYRIGANNVGFAVSGVKLLDLGSALVGVTGALTVSTTLGVTGTSTLGVVNASGGIKNTNGTGLTPPPAGSVPAYGLALIGHNGLYGTYAGVDSATGNTWFQAMQNNSAVYYTLLLNPTGGNVTLGAASSAVTIPGTLQVGTAIQITTSNAPQVTPTGFYMNTWPTTASPANTNVTNGDYAKLVTSLRANKTEIASISEQVATDTVMAMRGVTYRSAIDEDQREWAGFIAEETKEANPTLAMFDSLGDLQSISYDRVPAYMIPVLQKHEREIQALRAEIQQLRNPQ